MYVDRGGFLFAEQCCGSGDFDRGFRALMAKMFPEPDLKLRPLPADHPAWYADEKVDPSFFKEPLWGIDVGCRTSVIYSPQDLSCYWELARPGREKQYSARRAGANSSCTGRRHKHPGLRHEPRSEVQIGNDAPPGQQPARPGRSRQTVRRQRHSSGGLQRRAGALATLLRLAAEKLEAAHGRSHRRNPAGAAERSGTVSIPSRSSCTAGPISV